MNEVHPRVSYAFFCEMVRPEPDGKTTAIGLWGQRCRVFATAPAMLGSLGLHAHVVHPPGRPIPGRVRMTYPGNAEPVTVNITLHGEPGTTGTNLNINQFGVTLRQSGVLRGEIELDLAEGKFTQVVEMEVVFDDSRADSTAS